MCTEGERLPVANRLQPLVTLVKGACAPLAGFGGFHSVSLPGFEFLRTYMTHHPASVVKLGSIQSVEEVTTWACVLMDVTADLTSPCCFSRVPFVC